MRTEGRSDSLDKQLQRHSRIDTRALDPDRYTETLLSAALESGVVDGECAMSIQGALFDLLSERLVHMTNGESCSVPAETAQAVMEAMLYTLDWQLLAAPTPDDAVMWLRNESATSLYEAGLHRIKRRLRAAQMQYRRHTSLFQTLPDSVMKTTAIDGIAGFFRAYHPDGFADAVPITADYPMYLDSSEIMGMRGVRFLSRYLDALITEARFLTKFRADTLNAVLSASEPLYHEAPTNLYAPMLASVIGMALLHRPFPAWKYGLQGEDIDALQLLYDAGDLTETGIRRAAGEVIDLLMLDGADAAYLFRAAQKLYESAAGCLRRHLPMLVFPCTDSAYRREHRGKNTSFDDDLAFRLALGEDALSYRGGRMDADAFRCLDYDLRACMTVQEKTERILSRVRGLEDICDLLNADTGVLDDAEREHLLAALPEQAREILSVMTGNEMI